MPRYVILEHDYPELHWDFMLESGEVLRTWRLAAPPDGSTGTIQAAAIGDHRRHYLDYEGPVSGGRGAVKRWDSGEYRDAVMNKDRVHVFLDGLRLKASVVLARVHGDKWTCELAPRD